MSMPSSRLLVATTQRRMPDFSASSISALCSLLTEPWCARASRGAASSAEPSGRAAASRSAWISLSRAVSRSARRREFANTIVDRFSSTRSTMSSSTWGQIDGVAGAPELLPPSSSSAMGGGAVMSSTGTTTRRSKVFVAGGCTIVTGVLPPRNRATSSTGRTVAERPMRCTGRPSRASSRSRLSARCAPRLVPATACTSSTMTVRTPSSVSRALEVSMRYRLSGVVMRMSGGEVCSLRRSALGVSPERTPTVTVGGSEPRRRAVCVTPMSGERRLRSTSTPSALSGEM